VADAPAHHRQRLWPAGPLRDRHRAAPRRRHQGRPPDLARRGSDVYGRHRLRAHHALPARRRHARPRRLPALP
jgi:hypothetical protein